MTNECYFCGKPVEDFEPIFCCSGQDCGCQGHPIDPPMHESCITIDLLEKIKEFCAISKSQNISISMCRSFPVKRVTLENHGRLVSSANITSEEGQYIMDCQGYTSRIADMADYLIKELGGGPVEDNPEEKPKKIKNRWEILDL